MSTPVFYEIDDPATLALCACAGCARARAADLRAGCGARPAARVAAVAALGAVTLSAAGTAQAATPRVARVAPAVDRAPAGQGEQPGQGAPGPLFAAQAAARTTSAPLHLTRAQILARAQTWVDARVPYSMSGYYQGYRKDCSGFVSMAWGLGSNQWTGSLAAYGTRIGKSQLRPGDMLLFHNPANPTAGSHVTIFGGWADASRTKYLAYEQTRPHTRKQTTPYAYWNHSGSYVPYRYKYVVEDGSSGGGGGGGSSARFPGTHAFGPGANNAHVTRLGKMLVQRGGAKFYTSGPGPRWSQADRRATQAFQRAQGWSGRDADGIPGPATWRYLVEGKGRDIGGSSGGGSGSGSGSRAPALPGRGFFRPGQSNAHVTTLGRQLVKKGYGRPYAQGPGPRWSEADRRAVEAFQRAQGWRGGNADGYPGPATWQRLFAK
ncbi:peptidoglycan-binding protein [Streptomyces sp. NPDC050095]|uniref:peptidoglycan-binding protein n=1 Tax=unclassified Streptomyces TaxID=2593676 RepID=UPI00342167BE